MLRSYLFVTPLLLLTGSIALKIKNLEVPSLIELGKEDSVILDCEYSLEDPSGLVVKWFVNKLYPVYQWIPHPSGNLPQGLGLLKGKIDLGYKASSDPLHAHRAIKILNPTVDMSGNYTCVVSTFAAEDTMTKSMLVYSLIKDKIQLSFETVGDDVHLLCRVEDVYPVPIITIMANSLPLMLLSDVESVAVDGLYDVRAEAKLSASNITDGARLECRVTLPQTNYTDATSVFYYPGTDSTAHLAAVEAGVSQRPLGNTACRPLHSYIFTAVLAALSLLVGTT